MNRFRALLVFPVLALLAGCAAKAGLSKAQKAQAEALFKADCAGCHDRGATGAPARAALAKQTPEAIREALETGVMREQGRLLKASERALLAEYLGAKTQTLVGNDCKRRLALDGAPLWNRWGNGLDNRRYQSAAAGGLTLANVGVLELKWAFAFPGAARARSQPAVTREAIFTGSQDGRVYALGLEDGCQYWSFAAASEVRSAPTLGTGKDGRIDRLYFGDFDANMYALDARSGKLIWKVSVKDHPAGTITGSPSYHDGRLYVPMSSTEVVSAMDGKYRCCTFRGGVTALDAATGKRLWRMHTTEPPVENGKNRNGIAAFGPSGAPVWSPPTIDPARGLLYVGTGENHSSPANGMSDAIVAIELASGRIRWVRQVRSGDAWNASCGNIGNNINCPKEDGPDLDFGAPPILAKTAVGREIILAGQKSGLVFGIDPDSGRILWQQRAGMGGFNGGVHWGMASDGRSVFAGIADTPGNKGAVGPPRPGVHAFDAATGKPLWSRIEPRTCEKLSYECMTALSAPLTVTDGIAFGGAHNGLLRAYAAQDGRVLWSFDTRRAFESVNGVAGQGGSIDSAGPVIAGGRLIVNSGYDKFGEIPGNVMLVFGPKAARR